MSHLELTMKSGAVVTFDCTETEKGVSRGTGDLVSLSWTLPEGATRRPLYIRLDEVAVAMFVDDSEVETP